MSSNNEKSSTVFWLNDPGIIFDQICSFNPFTKGSLNYILNAYSRLIMIITIILIPVTKNINVILYGIIALGIIILIHKTYSVDNFISNKELKKIIKESAQSNFNTEQLPRKESDFQNLKKNPNNPLKNTLPTEFGQKSIHSGASQSGSHTSDYINGKFLQNPSDYVFDSNTRQFFTMPNTLVPNAQTEFANWLYGTENNCRSGSIHANRTGLPEASTNCTGFDVSVPTNYGKL